ncbi:MAG: exonuclease SbcCD subunit D [Candidatus Daviesbacteria bacterium]|nr:exonuclease SbcCD subunit D [Candidatus Daviesbacteria bacterium]
MKLLHTGDLHIGMSNYSKLDPETGLDSRLIDFFNTFDLMVDTAISEGVDAFLLAGDAYKTRDPSPTQQKGFGERIKKLSKAGIPVILVVGNHDTPNAEGKANTLDIYSALEIDNVWVSRKPEFLKIPTKSGLLQVITAPWLHKTEFKDLGEKLLSFYERIDETCPAIVVGHLEVEGSSMGSEKGLAIGSDVTVPLSLLTDRRLSYVALGHIHKHQILSSNPPVVYSGSPERIDFGEAKEEKGFIMIDIPVPKKATFKLVPSNCRKFLSINVDLLATDIDPTETVLKEISKNIIDDAIVKVVINIPADLEKQIEMDKIKKALTSAFNIAGISRNVERKERLKLDNQIEVERLSPLEALQTYFKSKQYSPEKIKLLENLAVKVLES